VDDPPRYSQHTEYLTLVRIRIAEARAVEVVGLLDRMLKAAEDAGRAGETIELLVLRALARQAQGQHSAALADVERALALGEPEGFVRTFVDEGHPMATLLQRVALRRTNSRYVAKLLAAIRACGSETRRGNGETASDAFAMVEPLTERERDVLRLLAGLQSNAEIAQKLFLTVGTVKSHVHHILGKLGVSTRREAARKAADPQLL
jgi:LuxR family maltose regulon positive regulatory protein